MYCMAVSKGMNERTREYVPFQHFYELAGPPRWLSGEESCDNLGDTGLVPGSERLNGNPTHLILYGKSHGQRSLANYNPLGHNRVRQDSVTKHQKRPSSFTRFLTQYHVSSAERC